jgi:small subunit ribosomal protein S16
MLAIRFNRTGKRNHASFRVVLQEHTKAPGKRHIEILGSYDPHKKATLLNKDRILYWIGQGAQTSPVVTNLLVREGVIEGKKIAKKMPRPVVKEPVASAVAEETKIEETTAPAAEAEKTEEISAPTETKSEVKEIKAEEVSVPVEAEPVAQEIKEEETSVADVPAPVIVEEVPASVETAPKT